MESATVLPTVKTLSDSNPSSKIHFAFNSTDAKWKEAAVSATLVLNCSG